MKEIGRPFSDLISYNDSMAKAMKDKLFFVEKLPTDNYIFVDFGCADGSMLKTLESIFGNKHSYVGYDCSDEMLKIARVNCGLSKNQILLSDDWNIIQEAINSSSAKKVLILSSVIHEVYSYAKEGDVGEFYRKVLESGFDYIVVRDMMLSETISKYASPENVNKLTQKADSKQLKEFCSIFGLVSYNKNLIHFLLKYRWKENWDREVHENYFPIYKERFIKNLRISFDLIFEEQFRVPYIDECIKRDFDITLSENTHIKLIFKKK